jgi:hypothetical protein
MIPSEAVVAKKRTKKSFTLREIFKALSEIRAALLNDEIAMDICSEAGEDESILEAVPIYFEEMDVTAKTVSGKIMLNPALIDEPFIIMMRYVIHELVHVMQHLDGKKRDKDDDGNYLDKETEEAAFKRQIEFDMEHRTEKDVGEYIDGLLEYHDFPEKKREEKEEELKEFVD